MTDILNSRFLKYVKSLKHAREALGNYLLEHPEIVGESTDSIPTLPSEVDQNDAEAVETARKEAKDRAEELLDLLTTEQLSAQLLTDAGISPETLMDWMREDLEVPESFTQAEARMVLGIQYELSVRKVVSTTAYVMAEDISTGFISLLGIATRNGILLVSHYNHLRDEGMPLHESVVQGSLDRLNPILMTALSSALALIPLALGGNLPGNEIQSPMAKVILGGLLSSTLLNGFIIPSVYLIVNRKKPKA